MTNMLGSILNTQWFATARKIDEIGEKDTPQYNLCCRCWVSLVADICGSSSAYTLASAIRAQGLYTTIVEGENFAKSVLQRVETGDGPELPQLFTEIFKTLDLEDSTFIATVLQIARFPKRFTPSESSGAEKASIDKFVQVQAEVKRFDTTWSRWPGQTIRSWVADEMSNILGSRATLDYTALRKVARKIGCLRGSFSDGSTNDAGSDLGLKFNALVLGGHISYDNTLSHYLVDPSHLCKEVRRIAYKRAVAIQTVPKDFASRRLIASESSLMNWNQHIFREYLVACCTASGYIRQMDPEYQLSNRFAAADGSTGAILCDPSSYCTIDLSSASDRIPRSLFFSLFPYPLREVLYSLLPNGYTLPGKTAFHPMHMLASSGNVLTPILQSIFFLSLCRCAARMSGCDPDAVYVYNDDICIQQQAFQTTVEMLSAFGAVINEKKTYAFGSYRESCGGEYFTGIDVTPKLWPRRSITQTTREKTALYVAEVIQLQHRFYDCPITRCVLEDEVKTLFPKMTYSFVGAECDDLWASWVSVEGSLRSRHYQLVTEWVPSRNSHTITLDHYGREAVSRHCYFSFLEKGPSYDGKLDELLGVSSCTTSALQHYGMKPKTVWTLSKAAVRPNW